MSHLQDLSLREQARGIASGEIDPSALLRATLDRIEARDETLNSVVGRFPEEAAKMLDDAPAGPLHGVPLAVKDMFALPWRAPRDGTGREQIAAGESELHSRLRAAGAVTVGVTNMHYWGGGTTGHVSAYGPVGNPWDVAHCGGGSSGGSAAAVGARLVAGAVGTDGGGSVRIPAAYCGVTGLKGTFASTPVGGFTQGYSSMTVGGPLARDAADARLLGETMMARGFPAGDGSGLRIGLVRSPYWENLDPEVEAACHAALEASGWTVDDVSLEGTEHTTIATVLRLTLEGLPSVGPEDLEDAGPLARALVKYQLLMPGRMLIRADRVRTLLRRTAADAFETYDLLAWPTIPAPAPRIDNPTVELPSGPAPADPVNVQQNGFANLTGLPAISVPVGAHSSGLPMAIQFHAPWGEEAKLLDAAEHLENATSRQHVDAIPPLALDD